MKITVELDLTTYQGRNLLEYLYKQTLVEGPEGLQISTPKNEGPDEPMITMVGPAGAETVPASEVEKKIEKWSPPAVEEKPKPKPKTEKPKPEPEKPEPEKPETDEATKEEIDKASKEIRNLIIEASTLANSSTAEAMAVVKSFGVESTKDLTIEQAPKVIAALQAFVHEKKGEAVA